MGEAAALVLVAHAAHWTLSLGPVLVIVVVVLVAAVRERRAREASALDESADEDGPG